MSAVTQTAPLYRIEMHLAREPGHPDGDPGDRYVIIAPLDADGRLDAEGWRSVGKQCRVVKATASDEPLIGSLLHGPGGRWFIEYDNGGQTETEMGFRFETERFVVGEYVSIERDGESHPYRIVSTQKI